jgi:dUTP pyrophosphatase
MIDRPIPIKFVKVHLDARLPRRWSSDAVGFDLHAYIMTEYGKPTRRVVAPNSTINISTGLRCEIPRTHFGFVCPRSGLGKDSISVTNSPGIIDPDYRGEIRVLVYNGSYVNYWVEHDERIAQLVIMPVTPITISEVNELSPTERGELGFGSTGT